MDKRLIYADFWFGNNELIFSSLCKVTLGIRKAPSNITYYYYY